DGDNVWTEVANRRGVSAHWAAAKTWDYLATLNLAGVDILGPPRPPYITVQHAGDCGGKGTQFVDLDATIGVVHLCNALNGPTPDLDVESIAHELGHEFEWRVLRIGEQRGFAKSVPEANALSEHVADVVAHATQQYITGNANDWTLFD